MRMCLMRSLVLNTCEWSKRGSWQELLLKLFSRPTTTLDQERRQTALPTKNRCLLPSQDFILARVDHLTADSLTLCQSVGGPPPWWRLFAARALILAHTRDASSADFTCCGSNGREITGPSGQTGLPLLHVTRRGQAHHGSYLTTRGAFHGIVVSIMS